MSENDWGWNGLPPGEPISGKNYRAEGWVYRDPPGKFSPEMWERFLSLIGEENYVVICGSRGSDWVRGQLLISPQGMERLQAFEKSRAP